MLTFPSIQGSLEDLANNGIYNLTNFGPPTNGVSGANIAGPGSTCVDILTGYQYLNTGTLASPVWVLIDGFSTTQQLSGTISSANVTGTGAGQFGHANGVIMLPAPGTHVAIELISVAMFYKFNTAAYTAGGNITVNNGAGGIALTGLISAANSVGAAASKLVYFVPLSTAAIVLVENGPINLVTSAAFTQPGTAAGTITWYINYRQYNTGL